MRHIAQSKGRRTTKQRVACIRNKTQEVLHELINELHHPKEIIDQEENCDRMRLPFSQNMIQGVLK